MHDEIFNIYKPIGATPYQCVELLKQHYPEFKKSKVGYAGRLDPLAHGVLILMVGAACKRRDYYQDLPKVYQFDLLLGFQTDSFDPLGIVTTYTKPPLLDKESVNALLSGYKGEFMQSYPPYSSFHVNGKPLYKWAKEGKIDQIEIPSKKVRIEEIKLLQINEVYWKDLFNQISRRVYSVSGEFRQEEILTRWDAISKEIDPSQKFQLIKIEVETSSGTYVRAIADSIGKELKCGAIAFEIYRTAVGPYKIQDSLVLK